MAEASPTCPHAARLCRLAFSFLFLPTLTIQLGEIKTTNETYAVDCDAYAVGVKSKEHLGLNGSNHRCKEPAALFPIISSESDDSRVRSVLCRVLQERHSSGTISLYSNERDAGGMLPNKIKEVVPTWRTPFCRSDIVRCAEQDQRCCDQARSTPRHEEENKSGQKTGEQIALIPWTIPKCVAGVRKGCTQWSWKGRKSNPENKFEIRAYATIS